MEKIYRKLTKEQKERGVIFSSTFSNYTTEMFEDKTHEVFKTDNDIDDHIERLRHDKFFNDYKKYHIIRSWSLMKTIKLNLSELRNIIKNTERHPHNDLLTNVIIDNETFGYCEINKQISEFDKYAKTDDILIKEILTFGDKNNPSFQMVIINDECDKSLLEGDL